MSRLLSRFVERFKLLLCAALTLVVMSAAQEAQTNAAASLNDAARVERWRADVRFYAAELPKRHANLFFQLPKTEFEREIKILEAKIPKLLDGEIALELMRISARVGDGHTVSAMPATEMTFFPFKLEFFGEGWFVTEAADEYKQILGARLVRIGETKIEKAARLLRKFVSADNEFDRASRLRFFFVWAGVLQAADILPKAETGAFVFLDCAGKKLSIAARPISAKQFFTARWRNLADDNQAPPTAKNSGANYWFEHLPAAKTLYLAYNKCENAKDKLFADAVKEMFAVADAEPIEKFIVDLRRNSGGDSSVIKSLYAELDKRPQLTATGRLFVLTSNVTFSSAFKNAVEMRRRYKAVWVGESPGQKPNYYGEVKRFALPNSKVDVQYSTKFWEQIEGSKLSYLPVDVAIVRRFADYRAGRDAALQAIFDYKAR